MLPRHVGLLDSALILFSILAIAACSLAPSPAPTAGGSASSLAGDLGPQRTGAWIDAILEPLEIHTTGGEGRVEVRSWPSQIAIELRDVVADEPRLRRLERAVAAIVASPDDGVAHQALGDALLGLSRDTQALAAFATARRLAPAAPGATRGVARSLSRLGRNEEARRAWSSLTVLSRDPDVLAEAWIAIAIASHYLDESAVGGAALARAIQLGGKPPAALLQLLGETRTATTRPARIMADPGDFLVGAELRVDTGGSAQAAETSVARAGERLVAGWNDLREAGVDGWWRLGVGISTDGGATWNDRVLRPGNTGVAVNEGDPVTAGDPRTGDLWISGMTFGNPSQVYVSRLRPTASELAPPVIVGVGQHLDRPWLAAGAAPGDPTASRLYLGYFDGGNGALHVSADRGATWQQRPPIAEGVPHLLRVTDDGTLHVAHLTLDLSGYRVLHSTDAGVTFSPDRHAASRLDVWGFQQGNRVPGRFRVPPVPAFAVSPDGTRYLLWHDTTRYVGGDADVDIYLTRSVDGVHWTTPQVVSGDNALPGDQFFPWLEVDRSGGLHLIYFDTRRVPQDDDQTDGQVDVVYARSDDGGATWRELFVTDQPFSSVHAQWPGFEQFLGDFLSLAVEDDGRAVTIVYPTTRDGDLDIVARRVVTLRLFADGFESGDLAAWSASAH